MLLEPNMNQMYGVRIRILELYPLKLKRPTERPCINPPLLFVPTRKVFVCT
jgi:hypothetical protein